MMVISSKLSEKIFDVCQDPTTHHRYFIYHEDVVNIFSLVELYLSSVDTRRNNSSFDDLPVSNGSVFILMHLRNLLNMAQYVSQFSSIYMLSLTIILIIHILLCIQPCRCVCIYNTHRNVLYACICISRFNWKIITSFLVKKYVFLMK